MELKVGFSSPIQYFSPLNSNMHAKSLCHHIGVGTTGADPGVGNTGHIPPSSSSKLMALQAQYFTTT